MNIVKFIRTRLEGVGIASCYRGMDVIWPATKYVTVLTCGGHLSINLPRKFITRSGLQYATAKHKHLCGLGDHTAFIADQDIVTDYP